MNSVTPVNEPMTPVKFGLGPKHQKLFGVVAPIVGQWARRHESCRDRIKDTICAFSTIHSRTAVTGCVPIPQILKMKSEAIFAELQVDLSP
jgi:hypothetical protein